jgi:hypothetical protein
LQVKSKSSQFCGMLWRRINFLQFFLVSNDSDSIYQIFHATQVHSMMLSKLNHWI